MTYISSIGKYFLMLSKVFKKPQKGNVFKDALFREFEDLGLKSLGLVSFISFFIGAVVAMQTALNLNDPMIPKDLIGFATKRSMILEFSSTFIMVILAGKVGSFITSSIGTMRATEQIDALEVMGVNSLNYLVFPKVVATLLFYPFLVLLAMVLGIFGGWVAGVVTGIFTPEDYIIGIQMEFEPELMRYSIVKSTVFAFLIATIPSYFGYYVKGGALEVGRASTKAVVWTIIMIVITNYFLTQMLLS